MKNNPIKDFSKMPLSQLRIEFKEMMAAEIAKGLTGFSFTDRAQIEDTGVHGYELERQRLVGILTMHANSKEGNYEEYCPPIHPRSKIIPLTVKECPWFSICPNCGYRCGRERSGADFAGQKRCNNCKHVWEFVASNFYGSLP